MKIFYKGMSREEITRRVLIAALALTVLLELIIIIMFHDIDYRSIISPLFLASTIPLLIFLLKYKNKKLIFFWSLSLFIPYIVSLIIPSSGTLNGKLGIEFWLYTVNSWSKINWMGSEYSELVEFFRIKEIAYVIGFINLLLRVGIVAAILTQIKLPPRAPSKAAVMQSELDALKRQVEEMKDKDGKE